ncbi:hypothetical protein IscW_ISCW005135 [Ixodes scapularis]|uniref:Uncharacterized protein n=1 Tax=Ixodes scapularis TaxID=6945 RepID=B7PHK3_IXOSC|nr:hypothetical protein IscW_ISCW005135 [Ixodes scapularis]|eukprot:XP_002403009.1 hypothetical protein IscW_ISCW005135 [Ixodes scapularis]
MTHGHDTLDNLLHGAGSGRCLSLLHRRFFSLQNKKCVKSSIFRLASVEIRSAQSSGR